MWHVLSASQQLVGLPIHFVEPPIIAVLAGLVLTFDLCKEFFLKFDVSFELLESLLLT